MLKGILEAETEVSLIAGPSRTSFRALLDRAAAPIASGLLHRHGTRLLPTADADRAAVLAATVAGAGDSAFALVPADELDPVMPRLAELSGRPLQAPGALVIILEDDPALAPVAAPRQAAARLGLPCLEPADVGQLRDAMEQALRLSRAGGQAVAVVAHVSLLRAADTLDLRPNRVYESADIGVARRQRQRGPRWAEVGGALRMARRLELNQAVSMPSPGERLPVGFVAVGPAWTSLRHVAYVLRLTGRVPALQLGLLHPVDEAALGRLLARCEQVIVLEPRPGEIEGVIARLAERLRRRGERPATVWGREVPAEVEGEETAGVRSDADLHPSLLVRRVLHLLHRLRPGLHVAGQLAPQVTEVPPSPPRGGQLGLTAAAQAAGRVIDDVRQWLADRTPTEEEVEPTALAVAGRASGDAAGRVVPLEVVTRRDFERSGLAAIGQAAYDDGGWIFVVLDVGPGRGVDVERLARGMAPSGRAERVRIETANLGDRIALRDLLRDAALADRVTVVVVRDGPPPRFDPALMERALAEIDRLGFQPQQRLVRPADQACIIRQTGLGTPRVEPVDPSIGTQLRTALTVDDLPRRMGALVRLRLRPLLEQVDVTRTRPPARAWRGRTAALLPVPQVLHARQPVWRAHLAGHRGAAPGVVTRVLCDAGHRMGFSVRSLHDPGPIGAGRRAWAQVLFTHPRPGEPAPTLTAAIPFGEADLVLGLDRAEMLRGVAPNEALQVADPQRTVAVVNTGRFDDESGGDEAEALTAATEAAASRVFRPEHVVRMDFAGACRGWFQTDRLTDLAMIGAAFQSGLVPVTTEAVESAIEAVEASGIGRALEAFQFGRRLAVDPRLSTRPREDHAESVERIARRAVRTLRRSGWRTDTRAARLDALLEASLDQMPGLAETDPGRQARRDFVLGVQRCLAWGGVDHAARYAQLVTSLYAVDRGDRGRSATRSAILPLAEAMLIRDPLFIASVTTGPEERRRIRRLLNVKPAREDRLERRFLVRTELVVGRRRVRLDLRTGDWPAKVTARLRRAWPARWRGTPAQRELRRIVTDFVQAAIDDHLADYDRWSHGLARLHRHAIEGRLRAMAPSEARMITGPPENAAPAEPPAPADAGEAGSA
jgi:Pyruvate/2-oxoacid:ferredoxin oxidoreductase gamma subunit